MWWSPGVAERSTRLWREHPDWFSEDVISSSGDTADVYLRPGNLAVKSWNTALVERFLSYGIDGFKLDDIYNYVKGRSQDQIDYADLINSNLAIAQSRKNDFAVNICNCGLAQNFYLMSGQNQLITSDPVGSKQFRHRAKYLHALNVNGAAILADHVELTRGDISPEDMDEPGFYDAVDFTSVVPLGMVLQTKFRQPPGAHYARWFKIYKGYKFYRMQWVNIPLLAGQPEAYLLQDGKQLYFSFFAETDGARFKGKVRLVNLIPGTRYELNEVGGGGLRLGEFTAIGDSYNFPVSFSHSLVLHVAPRER